MKNKILSLALIAGFAALLAAGCERRPLEDEYAESALIPVRIDWTKSGIPVTDPTGSGLVHRVSLRFFPKDGSAAFDRFMETNVIEGSVEVPVGEYSVVVFNESVHDAWWEDAVVFSGMDSYDDFAATIVTDSEANYPFYAPLAEETLIVEPYRLASWSLDEFNVTDEMVKQTRYTGGGTYAGPTDEQVNALTRITMRRLTYNVTVKAEVQNLCSAQLIQSAVRGFARKVYMASAQTTQEPGTHVLKLNNRQWTDAAQRDGTVTKSFLSFGRLPGESQYAVNLDVVFVTGEVYEPTQSMLYDVTDQVLDSPQINIDINIDLRLQLPYVEGGIHVGDWDDEEINLQ